MQPLRFRDSGDKILNRQDVFPGVRYASTVAVHDCIVAEAVQLWKMLMVDQAIVTMNWRSDCHVYKLSLAEQELGVVSNDIHCFLYRRHMCHSDQMTSHYSHLQYRIRSRKHIECLLPKAMHPVQLMHTIIKGQDVNTPNPKSSSATLRANAASTCRSN